MIFFVVTDKSNEVEMQALQSIKPPAILVSYHYFKGRTLADWSRVRLGYRPEHIRVDCGAFSGAYPPHFYMQWIDRNSDHIDSYMSMDVIDPKTKTPDNEMTWEYYLLMKRRGYSPIPIYHYRQPLKYLRRYLDAGETFIAIGGCVPHPKKRVAAWMRRLIRWGPPGVRYHLFGSSKKELQQVLRPEDDNDSSSWAQMAVNGYPRSIPGRELPAKIERAKWQLKEMMQRWQIKSSG